MLLLLLLSKIHFYLMLILQFNKTKSQNPLFSSFIKYSTPLIYFMYIFCINLLCVVLFMQIIILVVFFFINNYYILLLLMNITRNIFVRIFIILWVCVCEWVMVVYIYIYICIYTKMARTKQKKKLNEKNINKKDTRAFWTIKTKENAFASMRVWLFILYVRAIISLII